MLERWWGDTEGTEKEGVGGLVGGRGIGGRTPIWGNQLPQSMGNVWEKEKETELVYSVELSMGKREIEKMVRDN